MRDGRPKPGRGRTGRFAKVVFALVLVGALYAVLSAGLCYYFIGGKRGSLLVRPESRGVAVAEVEFANGEGQTIKGWYAPAPERPCVVLAHGHRANRSEFSALYNNLYLHCRLGFLAIDFRASGESEGVFTTGGIREAADLRAAIEWLVDKGYSNDQIGVVAFDTGAVAAIEASAVVNRLGACVLIAPSKSPADRFVRMLGSAHLPRTPTSTLALEMAKWVTGTDLAGVDFEARLAAFDRVPFLAVAGGDDAIAPPPAVRGLVALVRSPHKQVLVVKGRGHGELLSASAPEVTRQVAGYLLEAFGL